MSNDYHTLTHLRRNSASIQMPFGATFKTYEGSLLVRKTRETTRRMNPEFGMYTLEDLRPCELIRCSLKDHSNGIELEGGGRSELVEL